MKTGKPSIVLTFYEAILMQAVAKNKLRSYSNAIGQAIMIAAATTSVQYPFFSVASFYWCVGTLKCVVYAAIPRWLDDNDTMYYKVVKIGFCVTSIGSDENQASLLWIKF